MSDPPTSELRERLAIAERLVRVDAALARRVSELMTENFRLQKRIAELEKQSCPDAPTRR